MSRRSHAIPLLLIAALACATPTPAPTRPEATVEAGPESRRDPIDVEHYRIDLVLSPAERRIDGHCTVRLRPRRAGLREVALDLEGLDVRSVADGEGRRLRFDHGGGRLEVRLAEPADPGDPLELVIEYGGVPEKGLWFTGDRDGRPTQAFTQGECEDARWWFPCHDTPDDRATSETLVTVPSTWTTVAAGERIDSVVDQARGVRRDHWRMSTPHPAYLATLAAGEFEVHEDVWEGVPLSYLAPEPWADRLADALAETPRALGFLSEVTGKRYPYPKYAQTCVEGFPFGGMENISATTLTVSALPDELERPDGDAVGLLVHEAAHQWFGDWLTCADWSHVWLNEGFASYMTHLYTERFEGVDAFRVAMRDARESYVAADRAARRAIVHGSYRDPMDLFAGGYVYAGGASRLHLLRFLLGDAAFFRGLRLYVGRHGDGSVVTDDLRSALEEASGTDLQRFFEQWVSSPGHPEFEVHWRWDASQSRVLLTVAQVQEIDEGTPSVFEVPVQIEVRGPNGRELFRREIRKRRELFALPFPEEPRWVRFDKYGWLPCGVDTKKTLEEWSAIAAGDDDVNGRLDAVRGLGALRADAEPELATSIVLQLGARATSDSVARVRASACGELGRARGDAARRILERAARSDAAAEVRVAALRGLQSFAPDPSLRALGDELYASRFSAATMGAAAALVARSGAPDAYDWITGKLASAPSRGVLAGELLGALGSLDDDRAVGVLVGWARDVAVPESTRAEAVLALGRLRPRTRETREALVGFLEAPVWRVRQAAVRGLAEGADAASLRALSEHYRRSVFPRERRLIERALRDGPVEVES